MATGTSKLVLVVTCLLLLTPSQTTGGSVFQGGQFTTVLESLQLQLLPISPAVTVNITPPQVFHNFGQFWRTKVTQMSLTMSPQPGGKRVAKRDEHTTHGISDECMVGFAELFNTTDSAGISDGTRALDAFGEIGAAYLEGNIHAYGGFDQCLDIPGTQYCLLHLLLKDVRPDFDGNTSIPQLYYALCLPRACSTEDLWNSINTTNQQLIEYHQELSIKWDSSMCKDTKSSTLNPGGVAMVVVCCLVVLLVITGSLADWIRRYRKARKKELEEQSRRNLVSSTGRRMSVSTLTLNEQSRIRSRKQKAVIQRSLSASCLLPGGQHNEMDKSTFDSGNLLEMQKHKESAAPTKASVKKHKPRVTPLSFLLAFSLFRTIPTIFSTHATSASVLSLNGMRSISMFWLILHHTIFWLFLFQVPNNSVRLRENMLAEFPSMTLTNAFFAIDTFLFLSATLVAYLTLRQMQRMKGRFPFLVYYIHRVLRILPTYMFILFGYWLLLPYFGSGPVWNRHIGPGRELYSTCERFWWTNLLFINNVYPWSLRDQCMYWGWYLAVDMQFYLIAPLVLFPLYKSLVFGAGVLCSLLVISITVTGALTGHFDLNLNIFVSLLDLQADPDPGNTSAANYLYSKPWARMPSYLVGLVMGYVFFKTYKLRFRKTWNGCIHCIFWIVAIFLCTASLYGIYPTWNGRQFTTAENVLYATLSPLAWSVGVALISFACYSNYGWLAGKFLSLRIWIPLSRLSFIAYLVNPIILMVFFGSIRDTIYLTGHTITAYGLATIILSFGLAAVLASCVEYPFSTLEVLVFRLVGIHRRESLRDSTNTKEAVQLTVIANVATEEGTTDQVKADDDCAQFEAAQLQTLVETTHEGEDTHVNVSLLMNDLRGEVQEATIESSQNETRNMDTDLNYPAAIHLIGPPLIEEAGSLQLVRDLASDDSGDDDEEEEDNQGMWVLQQSEGSELDSEEEAEQEI